MIIDFNSNFKTYTDNILNFRGIWDYECPVCHSSHGWQRHGTYSRFLILPAESSLKEAEMEILRLRCKSCGHTHAILPADIIPYGIYSVSAVIFICQSCLAGALPVSRFSSLHGVSYQMVYRLLQLFLLYLDRISLLLRALSLWVSAQNPSVAAALPFLDGSFCGKFAAHYRAPVFQKRKSTGIYPLHFGIRSQNFAPST